MDKNTKNLLTAGAVIVGGIILLKGAKEFLGEETPSGSFGGSGSSEEGQGFPVGDTGYPKTEYDYFEEQPFITPLQDPTIQKSLDSVNKSTQTSPEYAPLGSTPTSTFGIFGELPISLFANTWSFTGDKVGSGGGVYYPATKIYIDSSGQGYSTMTAPFGAYINNQGTYDEKTQTFTDIYGQKTSMAKEYASNRQLNIKQTSSTPLQTPDTSKLSETNLVYDVVAGLINPVTYLPFGLASQVGMEYNDYLVTKNEGKNILERNYTAEKLEKMSAFEKSIKQEYQKVAEPLKTTGGLIKSTAVKIGSSQLSTAKKVVSYAQSTASNVVNAVKTSVGSTKSSSSKSSSGSSSKSSGSSSSSKSSSASSVNLWNSAVKQAQTLSSSSKSSSASSVNLWNSAVKQAQTLSSSSKSSSSKSSIASNVINTAVKIGSSQLSTASKVVSYAKNTASNVINKLSKGKSSSSKSTKK